MPKRKTYSNSLSEVITKKQQLDLIDQVEKLIGETFVKQEKPGLENMIEKYIGYQFSESIISDMKNSGMSAIDFFKGLVDDLEAMDEAKIQIPIDLPKTSLDRISQKIKQLLGKKYILDVSVSSEVIAGMVVEINGKYIDYSFDKIFDNKFDEIKKSIAERLT